jgi:hypothetical protein
MLGIAMGLGRESPREWNAPEVGPPRPRIPIEGGFSSEDFRIPPSDRDLQRSNCRSYVKSRRISPSRALYPAPDQILILLSLLFQQILTHQKSILSQKSVVFPILFRNPRLSYLQGKDLFH